MRKKVLILSITGLFLLLLIAGSAGYWAVFGDNSQYFAEEKSLKIPPGTSFQEVVGQLAETGIINRPWTLELVGNLTGWGEQVKPGHYLLSSGLSNYDILDTIRKGLQDPVRLTIPPGTTPDRIAEAAGRALYFDADDFLQALKDPALAAELGTDTTHLFGYMMPETYFVYWLSEPESIIRKVKGSFDDFFGPELQRGADSLGLSVDEVLRVASIVDWETNHVPEKATVAGVYLNRLHQGWRLDADPTVQYGLLEIEGRRRRLFRVDYQLDHPYNTYRYRGLQPGPLNNPTPSAVRATVKPEKHNYMFFVALGDGTHNFSRTLSEHVRKAREYHRLMAQRRREAAAAEQADGN